MSKAQRLTDMFDGVIYSYSRAQAIAEGVLVDVTEIAKEAGFKWPVVGCGVEGALRGCKAAGTCRSFCAPGIAGLPGSDFPDVARTARWEVQSGTSSGAQNGGGAG